MRCMAALTVQQLLMHGCCSRKHWPRGNDTPVLTTVTCVQTVYANVHDTSARNERSVISLTTSSKHCMVAPCL